MSAQDELPPGWEYTTAPSNEAVARGPVGLSAWTAAPGHRQCAKDAWRLWSRASGITREELATMRAAVDRCAELEAALESALVMVKRAYEIGFGGTYGLDGSPYALAREIEKSGLLSDTPTGGE
jgi:hypothetical protein